MSCYSLVKSSYFYDFYKLNKESTYYNLFTILENKKIQKKFKKK